MKADSGRHKRPVRAAVKSLTKLDWSPFIADELPIADETPALESTEAFG